ncbi:MAG: pyrroline-5-carboxylate reductase [Congregibacter sp.]
MKPFVTAFIGAGNLASSVIHGLLADGFDAQSIRAADPSEDTLERLRPLALGAVDNDNRVIAQAADVVVLAVKPQRMQEVCEQLAPALHSGQAIVSVAAGVTIDSLHRWLGEDITIIRCMPNTPALLGLGATGIYADSSVTPAHREQVERIMRAVGVARWVDTESLLHAVTAISGSGPAYFFQFMQAMIEEGQRMGLDAESARTLCAQTCIGAGSMLMTGDADAAQLTQRVCSPRGTTEPAVAALKQRGLAATVSQAMQDCHARSIEMSKELS